MTKTAMAEAFNRAGIDGVRARLCTDAVALLRRHGTPERAIHGFLDRLKISAEVRELIGMGIIQAKAMELLRALAADMQGAALKSVSPKGDGAARACVDSHKIDGRTEIPASVPASAGGGVQARFGSLLSDGPAKSSEGEEAPCSVDSQEGVSPSPSDPDERGAGQMRDDNRQSVGRSALTPHPVGKPRGLDIMRKVVRAAPDPDVYVKTSHGRVVETMCGGEIDTLLVGSARDVALARFIKSHGVPVNVLVGKIISRDQLAVYNGWANEFANRLMAVPPIGLDEFFNQKLVAANG